MAVGLGHGDCRTVGRTIYVRDISAWLRRNQGELLTAVLMHEQVHAQRQEDRGLVPWLARYLSDPDFQWAEEQRGWYVMLRHLQRHGYGIDVDGVAESLAGYFSPTGRKMVSKREAREWAADVLAGRWHPSSE